MQGILQWADSISTSKRVSEINSLGVFATQGFRRESSTSKKADSWFRLTYFHCGVRLASGS
jgi:hypothetical protein